MRGSIRGVIVRADGVTPIPEATVSIVRGPGPVAGSVVRVDGRGAFSLSDLDEGEWLLSVSIGSGPGRLVSVHVHENAVSELVIEWTGPDATGRTDPADSGTIQGRVVRIRGKKPIANATITVLQGAGPAPDIAPLTNRSGTFALDGLPPGAWTLRATSPHGREGEATVVVTKESVAVVTIELDE